MTTSVNRWRTWLRHLGGNWPALLLVPLGAETFGVSYLHAIGGYNYAVPCVVAAIAVAVALFAPQECARIVPFALLAYAGYGVYVAHGVVLYPVGRYMEVSSVYWGFYGVIAVFAITGLAHWLLPEAAVFAVAGLWLLARPRTRAPGGAVLRAALAQLRGGDGQPGSVPALLLLPVFALWAELLCTQPAPDFSVQWVLFVGVGCAASVAAAVWFPRIAGVAAVGGLLVFGAVGVLIAASWPAAWAPACYGLLLTNAPGTRLLAGIQGVVLFGLGCALVPRLLAWDANAELASRALALARRVDQLAEARADASEVAIAELRRIERDLHDGAQARLVAVGMSLRAAEELMRANPEAALALVAEARETSSRALDDLRGLLRGSYPPVLADRGLADAVRALALDAPLTVGTDITAQGEPPMPVAAAVYFGIAEALTNAVRHSGADTVQIGIGYADGLLRASIADDGAGGADASRGTGLAGVQRRLATFDGILTVTSPVGGPTIVVLEVPCSLQAQEPPRLARFP